MAWADDLTLIVEIGFGSGPLAAAPTWTDVTSSVRSVSTERGREPTNQRYDPGTATIVVDNTDGTFDPNNSSSTHFGDMKLGTPIRIRATHSVTTYPVFYGRIAKWPLAYAMPAEATVALEAVENIGLLFSSSISGQSYVSETSDSRIGAILDDVGWPAAARDLDAGVALVAALTAEGEAGLVIDNTVEAEQGRFFVARNGDARFLERTAFSGASSSATFGGVGGLDYVDIDVAYDEDLLVNRAAITPSSGGQQIATDATSITDHGERLYESINPSVRSGPAALNVGEWIVGKYKDVKVRITGLKIEPAKAPSTLWPEVLGRELGDLVTVKFDPPGAGSTLDQVVVVEKIKHEVGPGFWRSTYGCHPLSDLEGTSFWILGTSTNLGTDTILA